MINHRFSSVIILFSDRHMVGFFSGQTGVCRDRDLDRREIAPGSPKKKPLFNVANWEITILNR